jgi:ubiquitin C-terminal hydrolase
MNQEELTNSRSNPKIGQVGFRNIGNTCYMASVLQLLIHCTPIISFLIYRNDDNSELKNQIKEAGIQRLAEKEMRKRGLSPNDQITIKKQDLIEFMESTIVERLADIINMMVNKGNCVVTPSSFKKYLDNKLPMFEGFHQQDASELLINLIDVMFEQETGKPVEMEINNVPNIITDYNDFLLQIKKEIDETESSEHKKSLVQQLNEYKENNKEIINKYLGLKSIKNEFLKKYNPVIFQIKLFTITEKTCVECKNTTSVCEPSSVLQLNVVPPHLNNCFEKFAVEEEISNYDCGVCKCKRNVKSRTKIFRSPNILFISLKRFRTLPNGRFLKDDRNIEIPLELDINPWIDHSMTTDKKLSNIYTLKGISNHNGGLNSGHYTADCAGIIDPENWYHYNDSTIQKWEDSTNIDKSDAYILMYQMKN